MTDLKLDFSTRAIHSGEIVPDPFGSLVPPVYITSTFCFDSVEDGAARFQDNQNGYFYSRISNPTLSLLESRLANLEEAEAGLVTASGMGAISATLWSLLAAGDHIVVDKTLYGCTYSLLKNALPKFGVEVSFVDFTNHTAVSKSLTSRTKAVFFESPTNPNMRVIDIERISKLVHGYSSEIKVIVDNTYCSPVIQRPMSHGADLVVHSATKYLGGHGDLLAGAVVGNKSLIDLIRLTGLKDMTGSVLAPLSAFLILRGLKTLHLRIKEHSRSAYEIAMRLEKHPAVQSVLYPGLSSNPFLRLAKKQMDCFGGVIAFELKGDKSNAIQFLNNLRLIKRAVSLGDAESLCQHPASMTHSTYSAVELQKHDISDKLIRLSVGLEATDDIYKDILNAL